MRICITNDYIRIDGCQQRNRLGNAHTQKRAMYEQCSTIKIRCENIELCSMRAFVRRYVYIHMCRNATNGKQKNNSDFTYAANN